MPAWKELQPLLIRSAGAVGVVAIVLAAFSSDAFRLNADTEGEARKPVIAAASELPAAPLQVAMVDASAPILSVSAPEVETSAGPVKPEPPPVEAQAEPSSAPIPDLRTDSGPAPERPEPIVTASVDAGIMGPAEAFSPDAEIFAPGQPASAPQAAPPPLAAVAPTEAPRASDDAFSLTALRPSEGRATGEAEEDSDFDWPNGAETCQRDWVTDEGSVDHAAGCMTTASLIAPVDESEQSALEDLAADVAKAWALLPRLPLPRPEPPADFEPSDPHKTTIRVSRRNSSWPDEPPPNCGAGQRAKWRFTNRRSGAKEWYCR